MTVTKMERVKVPEGMTEAEFLRDRLNELQSMEKVASELGYSLQTVQRWCDDYSIKGRRVYFIENEVA